MRARARALGAGHAEEGGASRPAPEAERSGRRALEENPFGRALLFKKAREETQKKTRGHYPAAERVLDVLERYGKKGFAAAAELEAKAFGELVVSETAHRLIEIFFATTALKKDTGVDDPGVTPREVGHVGMLGGGLMGGGIAYVTIQAGIPVRLKDKDDAAVGRGLKYVRGILDERARRKQITREELEQRFALLTGATDYSGLKHADVVIEAVFEDLALKQEVLREVEAVDRRRLHLRLEHVVDPDRVDRRGLEAPRDRGRDALLLPRPQDAAARGRPDGSHGPLGGRDRGRARQEAGQDGHRREGRRRLLHEPDPGAVHERSGAPPRRRGRDRGDRPGDGRLGVPGRVRSSSSTRSGSTSPRTWGRSCTPRSATACSRRRG